MADCLFCKIAQRELEADVVYETGAVLAFRDIAPVAPTHVLLIPKEHLASVADVTTAHGDVLVEMLAAMSSLAESENLTGGYRIVTNVGSDAGQSVNHLHWHLIGGRKMEWPPG
jgi:histidine triad (HIT) family protein